MRTGDICVMKLASFLRDVPEFNDDYVIATLEREDVMVFLNVSSGFCQVFRTNGVGWVWAQFVSPLM